MKKTNLLLMFLLLASALSAQQTFRYAVRDTLPLHLDFYRPAQPRADKACVLYVFGGGFYSGARNDSATVHTCRLLSERGFAVVAIDYRLYMRRAAQVGMLKAYTLFDTSIRWAVEDCSEAIAFVCRHADEWGIDPARIVLAGSSAGAITVLQTDYARSCSLPMVAALPAGWRPAAVVSYSGGIFCRNRYLHYVLPPAPTAFFHGTVDRIVAYRRMRGSLCHSLFGSHLVAREFSRQGYSHWILRFDDRGHEVAAALPATIDEFCAFVDATLSGRRMAYDATCTNSAVPPSRWTHMTLLQLYGR